MSNVPRGSVPRPTALASLARDPSSRARFLKVMGGTGAAGALAVLLAACGDDDEGGAGTTTQGTTTSGGGPGDLEVLNYALTLEHLEAAFYDQVAQSGLFSGAQQQLVRTFGAHEQAHVEALTQTITTMGGTPATAPATAFTLDDAESVITTAAMVENLGASAYLGAAPLIQSPEVLAAALSIHSVEARHAAVLNRLTGESPTPDGAFAVPATMDEVLKAVQPFLA